MVATISVFVGNVVLFGLYAGVFVHVYRGTRFKLFLQIIGLMMASSIFAILNWLSADEVNKVYRGGGDFVAWGRFNAFAYSLNQACFGVAHWLFAFEYFNIAKTMPLALKGVRMDYRRQKGYDNVRLIGNAILIFIPAVIGLIMFFAYSTLYNSRD